MFAVNEFLILFLPFYTPHIVVKSKLIFIFWGLNFHLASNRKPSILSNLLLKLNGYVLDKCQQIAVNWKEIGAYVFGQVNHGLFHLLREREGGEGERGSVIYLSLDWTFCLQEINTWFYQLVINKFIYHCKASFINTYTIYLFHPIKAAKSAHD